MFIVPSIIGFLIILVYSAYVIYKDKSIPQSISATVYSLDKTNKWLFTFVMWAVGFMIAPQLFDSVSGGSEFLVFILVAGLIGIGSDPLVSGERNTVHYASAILSGIASQILVFINLPYSLTLWALYIVYTLYFEFSGKNMFMAEIIIIITVFLLCFL